METPPDPIDSDPSKYYSRNTGRFQMCGNSTATLLVTRVRMSHYLSKAMTGREEQSTPKSRIGECITIIAQSSRTEIKRQLLLYHQGGQRSKPAHLRTASVTTMLVSSRMTSPAELELSGVNGTSDYEQCNHIVLHATRLCRRKAHYTDGCELPETQF